MFDGRWRAAVDRSTGPVGQALHRRGVTADVLTATGLLSATATAVSVATGHLHLAILLLIVTGLHDLLDGPVAKAAGTASVRGAFFDSVTDRVADAVLMLGCAWYLVDRHEGHTALLPMGILAVTALISYERAKAESLGLSAKGGLMERAERMVVLGFAFLGAAFFVPVLWLLFVLVSITAASRFVKVWNAASGRDEVLRRRIEAWREGRVDSRWRAWREGRTDGMPRREPARRTTRSTGVSVRWRARRQEALSSRSGRARRERRERPRAARHAAGSAPSSSRSTFRRTRSPSSPSSSSSSGSGSGSGSTS
jgi:CDP-diacylglycerol---glycerol-3-phosphate 3-phosphatidyltransferase